MDKDVFTIIESAKQLQVDRQTIYNKIKKLKNELDGYVIVQDNTTYLKPEAIEIIRDNIKIKPNTKDNKPKNNTEIDTDKRIEELKTVYDKLIGNLEQQIKESNNKNDTLVNKLQEHIKTLESEREKKNKQLEEYNIRLSENNKLMENMQVLLNNYNKKQIVENIEQNKKWWKFWDKN